MAKEKEITTITIPNSLKSELKEIALDGEPYHLTIKRILNENENLKELNENKDKQIAMQENIRRNEFNYKLENFCNENKDNFTAYMVIMKIATDLVPTEEERTVKLAENGFIQKLVYEGKKEIVFKASELVKEQIKLGNERFYNQLNIIDKFLFILKDQIKNGVYDKGGDYEKFINGEEIDEV